jgi:hypothetical protein
MHVGFVYRSVCIGLFAILSFSGYWIRSFTLCGSFPNISMLGERAGNKAATEFGDEFGVLLSISCARDCAFVVA